ncbi:MAG TPA: TRAP transporter substrate-binding protein DctP [Alphaproteobacteria bacterium]|nr:TRAP transporter substrate-binding protein DctP [Alphaproteobacteria bacterium]
MKTNLKHFSGVGLAIILGVSAVGTMGSVTAASAEDTIRVLTFAPTNRNDLSMVIFRNYMKAVNERGKGVVKMDHIGGPEVVPLRSQVNAVSKGGIADWVMTFTVHAALVPEIGTVGLSRVTPQQERKAGFIALLDEAHKRINIKVIGRTATTGGFHIFSKKPIGSIASFKGMKVRSHSGYDAFFKALEARPIHMKISEIYAGLERGLVQAAPYPLFVSSLGLQEVICCAMADSFWEAHTTFSFINLAKWKSISAKSRKILADTQIEFEGKMAAMASELKAAERKRLEAKGVKFNNLPAAEAEKFKVMANDSRWTFLKTKIKADRFAKIEKMIRR